MFFDVKMEDFHQKARFVAGGGHMRPLQLTLTLVLNPDAELCLQQVDEYFKMKSGSFGDPDFYLGARLKMKRLSNSVLGCSMSSSKFIQAAV
jgi:hypothetical protein